MKVRGFVAMRPTGRPEVCYGKRCPEQDLEHEIWLTEVELLMKADFTRHARVGDAFADGAFIRDGVKYWVEYDNHTATRKQFKEKLASYGKIDGFILIVCHTRRRMKRLMQAARDRKDVVLFTRIRWLQALHVERKWIDLDLKRVTV